MRWGGLCVGVGVGVGGGTRRVCVGGVGGRGGGGAMKRTEDPLFLFISTVGGPK